MTAIMYTKKNLDNIYQNRIKSGFFNTHKKQIEASIRIAGADQYDLMLPETRTLPLVIHPNEHIEGLVYGRYKQERAESEPLIGRGVLVATDQRVLLIDKKPLFVHCDEISYYVIAGVTYSRVGLAGTVVLHSRMGDVDLRTLNQVCAHNFVEAVEAHIFTNPQSAGFDQRDSLQ